MINPPLVSVLMTVFNGGEHLSKAIQSILDQTFIDFEFIIIDDGSTDDSWEILDSFNDNRIKKFKTNKLNKGRINALNWGIDLAIGAYIAIMDQDDVSAKNRIEKQITYLKNHTNIALLGSNVNLINENGEIFSKWIYPKDSISIKQNLQFQCCLAHPSIVFKKEIVKSLGGYRQCYYAAADHDLWKRIASAGYEIENLPDFLLSYRFHSSNMSLDSLEIQALGAIAIQRGMTIDTSEIVNKKQLIANGISIEEIDLQIFKLVDYWILLYFKAKNLELTKNLISFGLNLQIKPRLKSHLYSMLCKILFKEKKHFESFKSFLKAVTIFLIRAND